MRFVLPLVVVLAAVAGCKKSATTAAELALTTDSVVVAGAWTGCIIEPHVPCAPITMTLTDSSLTDSTETITGSGNWGASVAITGKLADYSVVLHANTESVLQGWSFTGILAGNSLAGSMTVPGIDTTYQATFSRSP